MIAPRFDEYSLALIKDKKIISSSTRSGIRPLFMLVNEFKGKVEDCIIHDKVIGLAAAKLIVYSKIASSVITMVASKIGKEFLEKNGIHIQAVKVVDMILNKNQDGQCPMEMKAGMINYTEDFFEEVKKVYEVG